VRGRGKAVNLAVKELAAFRRILAQFCVPATCKRERTVFRDSKRSGERGFRSEKGFKSPGWLFKTRRISPFAFDFNSSSPCICADDRSFDASVARSFACAAVTARLRLSSESAITALRPELVSEPVSKEVNRTSSAQPSSRTACRLNRVNSNAVSACSNAWSSARPFGR